MLVLLMGFVFLGCGNPEDGNGDYKSQTVCDARTIQCGAGRHCEISPSNAPICVQDVMYTGTHTLVVTASQSMLNGCPALQLIGWDYNGASFMSDFNEPLVVTGVDFARWNGFVKIGAMCGVDYYSDSWPAGGSAQSIGIESVRWDNVPGWEFADGEARLCQDGDVENGGVKVFVPLPGDTANYGRCP
ncbi:hypothetical protein IT408_01185 [Candidatus Uhrbacteria bacterium]|nr:hypothetical protein [Candidatus Uhrbacteria bacterium]